MGIIKTAKLFRQTKLPSSVHHWKVLNILRKSENNTIKEADLIVSVSFIEDYLVIGG